jgi:aspartate aminotransferase-like enzyme
VFILGASGTGAMEAAVVNLLAPTDKALVVVGGKFGERWQNLLKAYGIAHDSIAVEWGAGVDPAEIANRLDAIMRSRPCSRPTARRRPARSRRSGDRETHAHASGSS